MELRQHPCKLRDETELLGIPQGIPESSQGDALQSTHHEIGPSIQRIVCINLRRHDAQFPTHMLSHAEIGLKQWSPIGRVQLDDMLFIHGKDDIRSKGSISSIAKPHKPLSRKPVPMANDLHHQEPEVCVRSNRLVVSLVDNERQQRFPSIHVVLPFLTKYALQSLFDRRARKNLSHHRAVRRHGYQCRILESLLGHSFRHPGLTSEHSSS